MLRKFLTEEERAEVEDECRRYTAWRLSQEHSFDGNQDENFNNDDHASEENNYNVGNEKTDTGRPSGSKLGVPVIKSRMKSTGAWLTPGVLKEEEALDVPSEAQRRASKRSSVSGGNKRPVTFRTSTVSTSSERIRRSSEVGNPSASKKQPPEKPETPEKSSLDAARKASGVRRPPKVLSVDEIFAKGIREWREDKERFRASSYGEGKKRTSSSSKQGKKSDSREKGMEALAKKDPIDQTCESPSTSSSYDDYLEYSETEESHSTMTEEQIHRKRMRKNLDIAADLCKLLVLFCVSFLVTVCPIWFLEMDHPPPKIQFNITEYNICFWTGSLGFLDELNPCPYRGYLSSDQAGNECLPWKDAIDGGNGLPGVGLDGIHYYSVELDPKTKKPKRDFSHVKESLRQFRQNFWDSKQTERSQDYVHRFCRRLGNTTRNYPVCLRSGPEEEEAHKEIYISRCWLIPCSIRVASKCYTEQTENKKKASG